MTDRDIYEQLAPEREPEAGNNRYRGYCRRRTRRLKVIESVRRLRGKHRGVRLCEAVRRDCGFSPMFWLQLAWWAWKVIAFFRDRDAGEAEQGA